MLCAIKFKFNKNKICVLCFNNFYLQAFFYFTRLQILNIYMFVYRYKCIIYVYISSS